MKTAAITIAEMSNAQVAATTLFVLVVVGLAIGVVVLVVRGRKDRAAAVAAKRETIAARSGEAHAEAVVEASEMSDDDLLGSVRRGLENDS